MKQVITYAGENPLVAALYVASIALTIGVLATPYYPLAVLPALAILSFAVLNRTPQLGYYIIIFLIPFGAYRGLAGEFEYIRLHWIAAFALLLLIFLHHVAKKKIPDAARSGMWGLLVLFLAFTLLSALVSRYPAMSFKHVSLLCVAYLFVFLTMVFVNEKGFRKTLPAVIIWSVSCSSFLSVLGYFFDIPFFAEKVEDGSFKRGTGTAPDPNNMSLMIVFALPFLFHWLLHARRPSKRALAAGLICICLLGLVTTFSRGGALVLCIAFVGLIIEYLSRLRPKHLGLIACGVAVLLVIAAVVVPPSYWERQKSLVEADDRAIGRRASYIIVAFDMFNERPLLGHGPGTFREYYATTSHAERFQGTGESKRRFAHNTYLEVLTGTGILGIAIFGSVILLAWRSLTKAKHIALQNNDTELAVLVGSYRLSFAVLLIYLLLFSDVYHKYLLLALGFSQVAPRVVNRHKQEVDDAAASLG